MSAPLIIPNKTARQLLIHAYGLAQPPTRSPGVALDLRGLIHHLGYVQLDTIRTVSRAHHHILWSRNQSYREPMLWELLADGGALFEHFTHDASILPIEFYPVWRRQFRRMERRFENSKRWTTDRALIGDILARIDNEGPLSTHAFETKTVDKSVMWARPPHKRTLDYLWYIGELSTSHRENFTKFYDLSERVIPREWRGGGMAERDEIDWLCREALTRITFGTVADIQDFWGVLSAAEVRTWLAETPAAHTKVSVKDADGGRYDAIALPDIEAQIETLRPPTSRLRILNPFDPLLRNRKRLSRLFGFDYRIEIFVPAEKRKWGYYVYPILEGDRLIGRIEVKADRKSNTLKIIQFWQEVDISWTPQKYKKLDAELNRLARLAGVSTVETL
ncbi:MAG: winged helix-turn-helix domain-containing protein [Maricaulaceae bacterium]